VQDFYVDMAQKYSYSRDYLVFKHLLTFHVNVMPSGMNMAEETFHLEKPGICSARS